jgi:E3 ubiquitin-protein ligase RGLG
MGCSSSRPVHPDGLPPSDADDPTPTPHATPAEGGTGKAVSVAGVRALVRSRGGGGAGAGGPPTLSHASSVSAAGAATGSGRWGFSARTLKTTSSFLGMGSGSGGVDPSTPPSSSNFQFYTIKDKYETLEEVSDGLRAAGLESSNLIVAIDFTKSNTWTGRRTFGSRSLHWVDPAGHTSNPYMTVISCIGKALSAYDDDNLIPVFGFGDSTTTDRSVFPFFPDRPARGFEEVLARYKELVPRVVMSGPTNFAPAIEAAIQIVQATRAYHILLIVADGQVTNRAHTEAAIVRASEYPLSIILVGVGDGPWGDMEDFDDSLPQRKFDNVRISRRGAPPKLPTLPPFSFPSLALPRQPPSILRSSSLSTRRACWRRTRTTPRSPSPLGRSWRSRSSTWPSPSSATSETSEEAAVGPGTGDGERRLVGCDGGRRVVAPRARVRDLSPICVFEMRGAAQFENAINREKRTTRID